MAVPVSLTVIPCLHNRVRMLIGPIDRNGAARGQHDNQRFARRFYVLEQLLLYRGQANIRTFAAIESVDMKAPLLTFKARRETYECDDYVARSHGSKSLIEKRLGGWQPV